MVKPENAPIPAHSLTSQTIAAFLEGDPVYLTPVSVVDGKVQESRYEPYDIRAASVDVMLANDYDLERDLILKEQLAKEAEREIENLQEIMEQRQKMADELNNRQAA